MIKLGVINGAKGILSYLPKQETNWSKNDSLTNTVLYSICINLVEKAESIRLLEEKKLTNSVGIITRSFLELYVQYIFILEKETDKRAKSFFYSYKLNVGKKVKLMLEDGGDELTIQDIDRLKKEIPTAENYDDFINYYQRLSDELYDNPKQHSQKWYNLHGEKRKFKQLMLETGFNEREYEFFYGLGSMDIHGNSSVVNLKFNEKLMTESSIPIYIVDEAVSRWLNTAVWKYAKYYGIDKKRTVRNYFSQIAISIEGALRS